MKAAFVGVSKISMTFAYTLKNMIKRSKNSKITISGVYSGDTEATVNAAIVLNVKSYLKFEDLLNDADIIFVSASDENLSSFSEIFKKNRIHNRILCHFSKNLDSRALYCGTTNTYVSFYIPYAEITKKIVDISDECIMFEGNGKGFEEFSNALNSLSNSFVRCEKEDKMLAMLAKHFSTDFILSVAEISKQLYKFAGVYSKKSFRSSLKQTISSIAPSPEFLLCSKSSFEKVEEQNIRKNISLLNNVDCSNYKDIYKALETYVINDGNYNIDEKERLVSLVKKLR